MDRKVLGLAGEKAVANFLKGQGFTVLARNYRKASGEIDIISTKGEFIVFTEVKTRKNNAMVSGLEAVNKAKQLKIIATADIFLREENIQLQPRYDIGEVVLKQENPTIFQINYYENAFDTEGF